MSVYEVHNSECREWMQKMPSDSVDAIVTDPPYAIGQCGTDWDRYGTSTGRQSQEQRKEIGERYAKEKHGAPRYANVHTSVLSPESMGKFQQEMGLIFGEALRVVKPGAHLLAFGSPRTIHRLTCAIEDAGWEIRDMLAFVHGSGFPKGVNVSKYIDAHLGAERKTVSVSCNGVGGATQTMNHGRAESTGHANGSGKVYDITEPETEEAKRWDGFYSQLKPAIEPIVLARKPLEGTIAENVLKYGTGVLNIPSTRIGEWKRYPANFIHDGDEITLQNLPNGASSFFYCAKPSKKEKGEYNHHPTCKALSLMEYLVKLVTVEGQLVLDPFMGSGTTGVAAIGYGRRFVGVEREEDYFRIAERRLMEASQKPHQIELFQR